MGSNNGLSARGSSINPALSAVLGLLAGGLLAYAVGNYAPQQRAGVSSTAALPQLADRLESVVDRSEAVQRRRDRSESFTAASEVACDDPPAVSPDDMKHAIKASTGWGTAVKKAGMLAPELWRHAQSHWEEGLHQWLSDRFIGHGDSMPPPVAPTDLPPQAHFCIVRVCPAYRMIFIRSSKTGTQSVYSSFGGECHGDPNTKHQGNPACFWLGNKIAEAGPEKLGFDNWDQMWANYTVFTIVRNPLDRAGSGYDYVNSRRGTNKLQVRGRGRPVGCEMPTFARFLKQPWILGFQDTLFECIDHRRELRTHDWYHIEPQNQCLFDNRENIVVDYIIRLEHIEEDLPPLIDKINANRAPGVPEMKFKLHSKNRGKLAKQVAKSVEDQAAAEEASKLRHLKKYSDCGSRCFVLAQQYFADDFRLLRFPTLPLNHTAGQ